MDRVFDQKKRKKKSGIFRTLKDRSRARRTPMCAGSRSNASEKGRNEAIRFGEGEAAGQKVLC